MQLLTRRKRDGNRREPTRITYKRWSIFIGCWSRSLMREISFEIDFVRLDQNILWLVTLGNN